jgi:signal transduction histidine kinase/DNA-binding response OmpR family regulator
MKKLTLSQRLDDFYDKLDIGLIVFDANLTIKYLNQWTRARLPRFCSHTENLTIRDIFRDCDSTFLEKLILSTIQTRSFRTLSQVFHSWILPLPDQRFSDGLMKQGCSIIPFNDPYTKETWALLQIRDDSDRVLQIKQLNQEKLITEKSNRQLKKAKEEAESANRSKSEFLANMSHEIRTPLNAVIGFSEVLSELVDDTKQKSYLDSIKTAGESLLMLINDILDLSKIEAGQLDIQNSPIDTRSIFKKIEQIFLKDILDKKLKIITEIDQKLPEMLFLDQTRLRQILLNLVGNAVKFTEEGTIKLSVETIKQTEDVKTIDLKISVEDTGIGILKKDLKKIFESFEQQSGQESDKYGGTGLGLSITKRLIELMNGQISVTSVKNQGSVFTITLKDVFVSANEPTNKRPLDLKFDVVKFEKVTILVVDDIESNRYLLTELLRRLNLDTITARNGLEAISLAAEQQPKLILMDLRMPKLDGFEATKRLKSNPKTKSIPIIGLSASASKSDIVESKRIGMEAYLSKPIKTNDLMKELSKFLNILNQKKTITESQVQHSMSFNSIESNIKNLPSLIAVLQNEIQDAVKSYSVGAISMSKLNQLGNRLKDLGQAHNAEILTRFSYRLLEYEQNFDIEGINQSLFELPEIIKKIVTVTK